MPFAKDEDAPKSFTGLNLLKSYYKRILEHINSTPAQMLSAARWLTYLCAETPIDKKIARLELITNNASKIGYKLSPEVNAMDDDSTDKELDKMLAILGEK